MTERKANLDSIVADAEMRHQAQLTAWRCRQHKATDETDSEPDPNPGRKPWAEPER